MADRGQTLIDDLSTTDPQFMTETTSEQPKANESIPVLTMSSSSQKDVSYDELSSLYEACLLDYRKVSETPKENRNNADFCRQSLQARVELLGAVQCAAMEAGPDNRYLAQALLEQTTRDLDQDAASPEQVQALETLLPKMDAQVKRLPLQKVQVDVDSFFQVYPECKRVDDSDESDSDSSEDEEEGSATRHRKKKPTVAAIGGAKNDANGRPVPTAPSNPYASKKNSDARGQGATSNQSAIDLTEDSAEATSAYDPSFNPAPAHYHPPNYQQPQRSAPPVQQQSWEGQQRMPPPAQQSWAGQQPQPRMAPSAQQAWEDHNRKQNPFQTAREFAFAGDQANSNDPAPQQAMGYNPYAQQQPNSPPPEQPIIRDSLKRKFQPPKRVAATSRGGGEAATRKTNPVGSRKPGGGGVTTRPPSAGGNQDDEDDLPEELKRFGKELVEKIESEIMDGGDPVTFHDIAGLEDAKQTVLEVVCWPMKRPDIFTGLRRAPNGLLLFGPPGTGKTLIGKAIAYESGATFFSISSSSLTSKWIGEGEKLVRTLFAVAAYKEPAVVFIDEIDSLLTQRKADENEASRRIKTEFLVQLDGTGTSGQGRVLVIGATNRPQELDEAARRRFTKRLYIPLPEERDREALLRVLLEINEHRLVDEEIKKLAKDTVGFSGADLKALSTDAALGPIRQLGAKALDVDIKDVPPIKFKHFSQALRGMKPSVASAEVVQYEEWDKTYGSKRAKPDGSDDDEM